MLRGHLAHQNHHIVQQSTRIHNIQIKMFRYANMSVGAQFGAKYMPYRYEYTLVGQYETTEGTN